MEVIQRLIRQFIPRPPTAEDLAVFTLCLESLPQFKPGRLQLVNSPEIRSFVYPSAEFKSQQWLYTPATDRWQSESEAIQWAYEILDGQTVASLSLFQIPVFVDGLRHTSLCSRISKHVYTTVGQQQQFIISSNPLAVESRAQGKSLSIQEVEFMRDSFGEPSMPTSYLHLWLSSFVEMAEWKGVTVLQECALAFVGSAPLVAFSTSQSQVLLRLAGQILGREPMANISDAQVLSSLLSWGGRTLLLHHEIHAGGHELLFNVCYLKPLATYAPIRVEFLASHFQEDVVSDLLDRIVAHSILNPNLIS